MSGLHSDLRTVAITIGIILLPGAATAQEIIPCPNPMPQLPVAAVSHQMFGDVCVWQELPDGEVPGGSDPISYFNDYSWRSFLALMWPAKNGQRGRPDSSLVPGAQELPTVFETFKAEWEIFHPNEGGRPAWNEYGGKQDNPCGLDHVGFGDVLLAAFSKFDNVVQPGSSGALIAQNGRYVHYSAGFNETNFQHIMDGRFDLRKNLPKFIKPFPAGAVSVKSAWIDMRDIPHQERFHTREAWLANEAGQCEKRKVGLVGLHIVAKTAKRSQWIWSTFEHVDNVADAHTAATFNKGDGVAMPDHPPQWANCPVNVSKNEFECPIPPPGPYNVARKKKINDNGAYSTAPTNKKYQAMLAQSYPASPLKNYQLVMTQWPQRPNRPDLDGSPAHTVPGAAADSAFANTTMETFLQDDIETGCMACHNFSGASRFDPVTQRGTDFVQSLLIRSHPRDRSGHFDSIKSMLSGAKH
jgi:hypothetical protein